jgi:hypothetical protein
MKRLDDQEDEKHVKACIYGPPGTGKTSFGTSAPKPLIAITERQALVHIKEASKRLGVPMPLVFYLEHANDLRNLVRSLHGDHTKPFKLYEMHDNNGTPEKICIHEGDWPETIVLDSATDACRLLVEEIRRQSPPQLGRDGLPVDSTRFWNVLLQRAAAMITSIRDLPMHAIFLALADDRETGDDDNKVRSVKPMMAAKQLAITLAAAVNVVGFTYRKTRRGLPGKEHELEYGVMTTGPEYMMTKPYRPLRDTEVPDFGYWVRVIRGEERERPAPAPSAELGGGSVGAEDKPIVAEAAAAPAAAEPAAEPTAAEPEAAKPPKAQRKRRAG